MRPSLIISRPFTRSGDRQLMSVCRWSGSKAVHRGLDPGDRSDRCDGMPGRGEIAGLSAGPGCDLALLVLIIVGLPRGPVSPAEAPGGISPIAVELVTHRARDARERADAAGTPSTRAESQRQARYPDRRGRRRQDPSRSRRNRRNRRRPRRLRPSRRRLPPGAAAARNQADPAATASGLSRSRHRPCRRRSVREPASNPSRTAEPLTSPAPSR